jgi:two-component system chemotaxis response regulator CheB
MVALNEVDPVQYNRPPATPLRRYQLVVMAASAGGLSALTTILADLPARFPLPIAIVQHLDPDRISLVADILARRTLLKVKYAEAREPLLAGIVYIAPRGQHMLIGGGLCARLTDTAKVHFVRPSADELFHSAALAGRKIIAVVLTGMGSDGAGGAAAIKQAGGTVIAQDEASSAFFSMPHAAIEAGAVHHVLPLIAIAPALMALSNAKRT